MTPEKHEDRPRRCGLVKDSGIVKEKKGVAVT